MREYQREIEAYEDQLDAMDDKVNPLCKRRLEQRISELQMEVNEFKNKK